MTKKCKRLKLNSLMGIVTFCPMYTQSMFC